MLVKLNSLVYAGTIIIGEAFSIRSLDIGLPERYFLGRLRTKGPSFYRRNQCLGRAWERGGQTFTA